MLAISAMDFSLITAHIAVTSGFNSFIYLAYYPALAAFAAVFASLWLSMAWATMVVVAYVVVSLSLGEGLESGTADEKVLLARLAAMYTIVLGVGLITRFEWTRRQKAMVREQQQQERIELSQAIHDTTAQTAYMIGLGIDGALKLAADSNPELAERLAATSALAKSAMWELRRPIDMDHIFEGRQLGRVLGSHITTFAKITSVPAEMAQTGDEPSLDVETRSRLLSIAHNALANAFLHAHAGRIEVRLDFKADRIRLSVSDNGIGLPDDYAERGRGFGGMEADAERLGGRLLVETGGADGGTTVTCVVPSGSCGRGD